jgi:hypothetical protein
MKGTRCGLWSRDGSAVLAAIAPFTGVLVLAAGGGATAFGANEVLAYGESITAGLLRRESAESGITCSDVRTSHGFSISRQAYQLF